MDLGAGGTLLCLSETVYFLLEGVIFALNLHLERWREHLQEIPD